MTNPTPLILKPAHLRVLSMLQEGWAVVSDERKTSFWISEKARLGRGGRTKNVSQFAVVDLLESGILVFDKEAFSTFHYRLDPSTLAKLVPDALTPRTSPGRREADKDRAAPAGVEADAHLRPAIAKALSLLAQQDDPETLRTNVREAQRILSGALGSPLGPCDECGETVSAGLAFHVRTDGSTGEHLLCAGQPEHLAVS